MTRTRIAILAALACLLAAPPALAANRGIVGTNGQAGQLRLDVSTEQDVRAVEGEPDTVDGFSVDDDPEHEWGYFFYACGTRCGTTYYFNYDAGGVLSNFASSNRAFRTRKGTRAGYSRRRAQRIEGRRFRAGCGLDAINYGGRGTRPLLQISADRRRVAFLSLHSTRNNVLDC